MEIFGEAVNKSIKEAGLGTASVVTVSGNNTCAIFILLIYFTSQFYCFGCYGEDERIWGFQRPRRRWQQSFDWEYFNGRYSSIILIITNFDVFVFN